MKIIAHRGLVNGPDKNLENKPKEILDALKQGYDCEIDLWYTNSELWLGHDHPEYFITSAFLENSGLWIHAKNLAALRWLTDSDLNYFWHQEDDFTLTSKKFIWTYPGKPLTMKSISVMPEWNNPELKNLDFKCYGICSDYANLIEIKFEEQLQ